MSQKTWLRLFFEHVVSHVKGHVTSYLMDDQIDDWWYTDLPYI